MIDPVDYFFRISIPSTMEAMTPDSIQMVSMIITILLMLTVGVFRKQITNISNPQKWVFYIAIAEYLFFILYVTIIDRNVGDIYQLEWRPLWSYRVTGERLPNVALEVLLNVMLFVPLGILLGLSKRLSFSKVLAMSVGLSVAIELLQLITRRGLCETDDVIHNTLGCVIGWCLVRLVLKAKSLLNS